MWDPQRALCSLGGSWGASLEVCESWRFCGGCGVFFYWCSHRKYVRGCVVRGCWCRDPVLLGCCLQLALVLCLTPVVQVLSAVCFSCPSAPSHVGQEPWKYSFEIHGSTALKSGVRSFLSKPGVGFLGLLLFGIFFSP